jgi:hypothetical protein
LVLQLKSILKRRHEQFQRRVGAQTPSMTSLGLDHLPLTALIPPNTLLALPQVKSKSLKKQPTFKRLAPLVQLVNSWELAAEGA